MDRRLHLKVKIKSLAEEARIIRGLARRHPLDAGELIAHKRGVVAPEARHALLAYGFLRGLTYEQIETRSKTRPDWKRVEGLIGRFGDPVHRLAQEARFSAWVPGRKVT